MTDAELRALCEAATPGPWGVAYTSAGEAKIVVGDKGIALLRHAWESSPDAAFIAAARTEVPRLLDENAALRLELAQEREHHAFYRERVGVFMGADVAKSETNARLLDRVALLEGLLGEAREYVESICNVEMEDGFGDNELLARIDAALAGEVKR